MYKPKSIYTEFALEVIIATVTGKKLKPICSNELRQELLCRNACFVSIHDKSGALRGCIGTIEPTKDYLYQEIERNAISACTRDSRFTAIVPSELPDLEISVDVLSTPEQVRSVNLLNPQTYGLILSDGVRRGVLLPGLEGIDSVEQQVAIVKRKAGLDELDLEQLQMFRFTSARFY